MPRRPKPPHLRLLEGDRSHRPAKPVRQVAPLGPMPDLVANDPDAADEWARITDAMPDGHFAASDSAVMSVHCLSWALLAHARRTLKREGMTCAGSQGQRRPHPAVQIAEAMARRLQATADRLGLDPVSRNRFAMVAAGPLGSEPGGDPDDDLLLG